MSKLALYIYCQVFLILVMIIVLPKLHWWQAFILGLSFVEYGYLQVKIKDLERKQ